MKKIFIIKEIREYRGISLRELSKLTNISYSYLSKLENNKIKNVNHQILYKISRILGTKRLTINKNLVQLFLIKKCLNYYITTKGINSREVLTISKILDKLFVLFLKEK